MDGPSGPPNIKCMEEFDRESHTLTEGLIGQEQSGFMSGRESVDQVFEMKQMSEKFVDENKSLYVLCMNLQKVYDRVHREAMCNDLGMYVING